jgi:hypothetical protein
MARISATGYVHTMLDKGQTFEEYAFSCARAFGALIMMRDDPMDATIPDEFKPSDYHDKAVATAKKELARLRAMTTAEMEAYGQKQKSERLDSLIASKREQDAEIAKCNAMLIDVYAWTPPTTDHEGLKRFMVEQIQKSIRYGSDYYDREMSAVSAKTPEEFHLEAIMSETRNVEYHTVERSKEIDRAAERTKWVKDLRESLQPVLEAK